MRLKVIAMAVRPRAVRSMAAIAIALVTSGAS
jgi:hypothetical protein